MANIARCSIVFIYIQEQIDSLILIGFQKSILSWVITNFQVQTIARSALLIIYGQPKYSVKQ